MDDAKREIIETLNKVKNTPIAPLKNNVFENANANSTDYKALQQYNAMLDNITIGAHTNKTIEYAGIEWRLRLLTANEYVEIRKEVERECKKEEIFSDYFIAYHTMKKILSKALTPSPFKTEGKGIFSEDDLSYVNYDVLEAIYIQYIDFVGVATQKPTEMTDEEIEAIYKVAEKKRIVLRELERPKLEAILNYAMNYSQVMEKIQKSATSNSSS